MARFYGIIGFAISEKDTYGNWTESIVERPYYGDIVHKSYRNENSQQIVDNINLNLKVSIVSDAFADANLGNIRYVNYHGSSWKVKSIEPQYPRIELDIGGLWNGPTN